MGGVVHGLLASLKSAAAAATDSFFKYVTLLLHGDGTNGAQNNTFLDGSTNNFTVTRNGNTTQGTFSPFSQTGWSNYFDGTGDYLAAPDNAAFEFGSGDYTVEAWVYLTGYSASYAGSFGGVIFAKNSSNFDLGFYLILNGTSSSWTGVSAIQYYSGVTNESTTATSTLLLNTWYHIAATRSSGSVRIFINGVQANTTATFTQTQTNTTASFTVGGQNFPTYTYNLPGYISDARVVKGTAVYTANFTPPTAPLTAISGTSLLTCQSNRFIDNSSNAFAITRNGDVSVQAFSPFNPTAAWSASTNGGSGYFDGTGDYLTAPDNAAFDFGSGDFTVELWYYPTSLPATTVLVSKWNAGTFAGTNQWMLYLTSAAATAVISTDGTNAAATITGPNLVLNQWNHVAFARSGNSFTVYTNGVGGTSVTNTGSLYALDTEVLGIGYRRNNGSAFEPLFGYTANIRIVKGTAVYTANFTPPTAPLTAITNTSLLLNFTNGGIFDNASQTVLETVGNAQVSTTQKKFGTGSLYFDGTDDRLVMPARPLMAVGSGNFTIEGWVYRLDTNTRGVFQLSGTAGGLQANTTTNLALGSDAGSVWRIYANNSAYNSTATWAINTWYHFALVRNSGTTTLYIDGTSVISQADTVNYTGQNLCIGGFYNTTFLMNGYIDDLRITNGYARYTANFTPPTAAFPDN